MRDDDWPTLRFVPAPEAPDRLPRAAVLVLDEDPPDDARRSAVLGRVNAMLERRRADSVARENRRAARQTLSPRDARWRLAAEAARSLVGDRMPPESRRRLISEGRRLGLGAFDANLVVAVVQHRARGGDAFDVPPGSGEATDRGTAGGDPLAADRAPIDHDTADRLALLAPPARAGSLDAWRLPAWTIVLAFLVGIACAGAIAWWIRGATTTNVLGVIDATPRPFVTEPAR